MSHGKSAGSWNTSSRSGPGPLHAEAVDGDAPAARLDVARERVEERRLPAARRAEQAHELAGVHLDVHVVQRDHLVPEAVPDARTSIFGGPLRGDPRGTRSLAARSTRVPATHSVEVAATQVRCHMTPQCASGGGSGPPALHAGGVGAAASQVVPEQPAGDPAVPHRHASRQARAASSRSSPRSGPSTATSQPGEAGEERRERAPCRPAAASSSRTP